MNSNQLHIAYFNFEQDFMEDNIRCIPMIVRFKLDACGIKLKLKEWSKMSVEEREQLAALAIDSPSEVNAYRAFLEKLILHYTGESPTYLSERDESFLMSEQLPVQLRQELDELKMNLTIAQWKNLSVLQRYALVKLSRPSHENKNFPKAMKEFGLA